MTLKVFKDYKRYPVSRIHGKTIIKTEYGNFIVSEYELRCNICKKLLGYKLELEDKPEFAEIYNDKNFFVPYFWRIDGECIEQVHGGFSRPVWKMEESRRQTLIEEWCE